MTDTSDLLPSESTDTPVDLQDSMDVQPARQPLQTLPTTPLNKRPHPIRINSSPLDSMNTLKSVEPMTPPATPIRPRCKRSSVSAGSITLGSVKEEDPSSRDHGLAEVKKGIAHKELTWEETIPRPYTKTYKFEDTSSSSQAEYGRGVWSVVYRALEVSSSPSSDLPTPPTSPINGPPARDTLAVLAVKAPSRRDAYKILHHEACILTYLHSFPTSCTYLVPFHGYDISTHSIILDPIPLNLDFHAKTAAASARTNFSTRTVFDPVIGLPEWSMLATHLISGLSFLHAHDCIHGDIKPANILLRRTSGFYEPLYCDFSSSLHTHDPAPTEITALTPDYSAPELLSSLTTPGIPTLPTSTADVLALGVTLLFAAIGESPYAGARMEIMRLSMAKEGRPLDFARGGDQGARVRKGGSVERCLIGAFRKEGERWGVEDWVEEVKKVLNEEEPVQKL